MQNQRKFTKSALGPATTLGLLGGLVSGRGDDRLRTAARGAAKGFGTDLGALTGGGLGLGLGLVTGAPILGAVGGGIGGGMLGHSLASDAIGPYETEEEKFERMLEAREVAQEKMKMKTAYEFGAKIAASSCAPCAMPNAPTNKKPYTSVSPAVTDASQPSEELGKPPVTETEHSEAKAKQPEEGVKSAYLFGKKVAAINTGSGIPRYNPPKPEELMSRSMPAALSSPGMQGLLATPPAQRGNGAGSQPSSATASWEPNPPQTNNAGSRAHEWSNVSSTGRVGPPRPSSTPPVKPDPAAVVNSVLGPVSAADRASADRDAQAAAAVQAAAKGNGGDGVEGGGMMDYLTNPYVLGGGLGAAGIAALLYHMSNQPKKKRRDEEDA